MSDLPENQLLLSLPPDEYARLVPRMQDVPFGHGDTLFRANGPLAYVYFPRTGLMSSVVIMANGQTMEVEATGREGMTGYAAALGEERSPVEVFCQVPGTCRRLPADVFVAECRRAGALMKLVHAYALAVYRFAAQSAACNGLHTVGERCAKWLLVTRDRVGANEFSLTQEYLAMMLGVRRASVTAVAGALQEAGVISYTRGHVRVLDAVRLEAAACECYGVATGRTNWPADPNPRSGLSPTRE